jgi:hypothetical protein
VQAIAAALSGEAKGGVTLRMTVPSPPWRQAKQRWVGAPGCRDGGRTSQIGIQWRHERIKQEEELRHRAHVAAREGLAVGWWGPQGNRWAAHQVRGEVHALPGRCTELVPPNEHKHVWLGYVLYSFFIYLNTKRHQLIGRY